jgi:hypothetical protein
MAQQYGSVVFQPPYHPRWPRPAAHLYLELNPYTDTGDNTDTEGVKTHTTREEAPQHREVIHNLTAHHNNRMAARNTMNHLQWDGTTILVRLQLTKHPTITERNN